mmetsp:Transcript_2366/g.3330  ORF Transcript_2366/g.3330 Transcript_2366/m.3330 type:complete len:280 (+) Transcript_2366:82-921(+)
MLFQSYCHIIFYFAIFFATPSSTSGKANPSISIHNQRGSKLKSILSIRGGETPFSHSLTTFDPKGTLGQIENANVAVSSGSTCIGIKFSNGVVLASPNQIKSTLVEGSGTPKIAQISDTIAMVYAGIGADSRVLFSAALKHSVEWAEKYGCECDAQELAWTLGQLMQSYSQRGGVRPFGVGVLLVGVQEDSILYKIEPSGKFSPWQAAVFGKGGDEVLKLLEEQYEPDLTEERAILLALDCIEKTNHQIDSGIIDVAVVKNNGITFHHIKSEEQQADDS